MKHSISRQLLEPHSPSSDFTTEGTIICTICQAVYAPSRRHAYLLQTPPIALESAFISMCHFCFRCRRPSCPNCWDTVYSICGQCARETQVPFRLEILPLAGTFVPSPPVDIDSIETRPDYIRPLDVDKIRTRPDRTGLLDIDSIKTRPDRNTPLDIDKIQTRPDRSGSLNVDKLRAYPTSSSTGKQKFARILTSIFLLLIFLLVIIIAVTFISANVNLFIGNVLHMDIRTELVSLWHFLLHLF